MNELGPKQQSGWDWNESQYVPISKYSLNATMFHYGLAIRTESYKIDKIFMNSRHVA